MTTTEDELLDRVVDDITREIDKDILKDLEYLSVDSRTMNGQEYLDDLKSLIAELSAALPPHLPSNKNKADKWQLSSTMINSLDGLSKNSGYWGRSENYFNDLHRDQIEILNAIEKNSRVVINKINTRYVGVSLAFLLYAYHFARHNSGVDILIISKYDFNSRKLYETFSSFVSNAAYRDRSLITLNNNSKIRFASEQFPISLHSRSLDLIIIDDAEQLTNVPRVLNDCLSQLMPQGKLVATKWPEFAFQGWKEVVV